MRNNDLRAKSARVGSGKSGKKGRIRMVDLSFQFHPEEDKNNQNRPTRPLTAHHSANVKANRNRKVPDRHRQLRNDIDKLLDSDDDNTRNVIINGYNINHIPTQGDQQKEYIKLAKALLQTNRAQFASTQSLNNTESPSSTHRSNRTHLYLTPTELRDQPITDLDLKLGRPTRTTLLRHRQRSNSAQLHNQFLLEARKETKKEARQRPATACIPHRDNRFNPNTEGGESVHSFLTGARYNRAHHFDARSLDRYGVFLPRSNPAGCFVTQKQKQQTDDIDDTTPPDSPSSSCSDFEQSYPTAQPGKSTSAPTQQRAQSCRPMTARLRGRQVWGEETTADSTAEPAYNINQMYEQFLNLPETLNIKGTGLNWGTNSATISSARTKSANKLTGLAQNVTENPPQLSKSEQLPTRGLPSITGSSICFAPPVEEKTTQEKLNDAAEFEQKLRAAGAEKVFQRQMAFAACSEEVDDGDNVLHSGSGVSIPRLENIKLEDDAVVNNRQLLTPPPNTPTERECHTPFDLTVDDDLNVDDVEDTAPEEEEVVAENAEDDDRDNVHFFITEEGGGGELVLAPVLNAVDTEPQEPDETEEKQSDIGAGDGAETADRQPLENDEQPAENARTCFLRHGRCDHGVNETTDGFEVNAEIEEKEEENANSGDDDEDDDDEESIQQPVIAVDITERPKSVEQKSVKWSLHDNDDE